MMSLLRCLAVGGGERSEDLWLGMWDLVYVKDM